MPIERLSDIHDTILRLLAECRWVSPALLELTGYSYTYRTRALRLLLQQQYIRKQGEGRAKAYAISTKGRNYLAAFYASRFREEVMEQIKQLTRNPDDRAVLRGDAAAMLSLAGYAVHPDDKPVFPAYTPPLPAAPGREAWRGLYQNHSDICYPDESDNAVYTKHLTSMNCYYDACSVKELLYDRGKDGAGVRYSRACGVLMTPSCLFRVYHSRDVAMKFHITGERRLQNLLLTGEVFRGYLPERNHAALLLGNDFTALLHILEHHLAGHSAKSPVYVKDRGRKGYKSLQGGIGERVTPSNLGEPSFYLPLTLDSFPLLRMMRYPFWQELLTKEVCRELFGLENQPRWTFDHKRDSVYLLFTLCLQQISLAMSAVRLSPEKRIRLVCLDWQAPLFRELLSPFASNRDIRVTTLPNGYISNLQRKFELYWGGGEP